MATDPDPAPEVKPSVQECLHAWTEIFKLGQGDSIDTYSECFKCSAVFHVYTFDPFKIRHENFHAPGTLGAAWTRGYAQGMRFAAERGVYIPTAVADAVDPQSVATDSKSTTP